MLKTACAICNSRRLKAAFDVEMLGRYGRAPQRAQRSDAARRAKRLFPELADYEGLFRNIGIETRYTCECLGRMCCFSR